jgi:two-component system alkaline phosphatase synthesis response regulator PhoP
MTLQEPTSPLEGQGTAVQPNTTAQNAGSQVQGQQDTGASPASGNTASPIVASENTPPQTSSSSQNPATENSASAATSSAPSVTSVPPAPNPATENTESAAASSTPSVPSDTSAPKTTIVENSSPTSTTGEIKKFILVAEDDRFLANIYEIKLKKENFEVVVARDGEQALIAARSKKPDFIILDLIMPVKNGFETLAELKQDPNLKDVKVIVLSNLGQEEDAKKAKDLGALDYVVKSNIPIQKIVEKIKEYL